MSCSRVPPGLSLFLTGGGAHLGGALRGRGPQDLPPGLGELQVLGLGLALLPLGGAPALGADQHGGLQGSGGLAEVLQVSRLARLQGLVGHLGGWGGRGERQ